MRKYLSFVYLTLLSVVSAACQSSDAIVAPTHVRTIATNASKPNVLVILLDDARYDMVTPQWMPRTFSRLADSGRTFTRAYANSPLCCPSRSTLFSGLWAHNHGVISNNGTYGGFSNFSDVSTVATAMASGGYVTGLIGKYINHYNQGVRLDVPWPYIPPGWHEWRVIRHGNGFPQSYYNNGMVERAYDSTVINLVQYGNTPIHYEPSLIGRKAVDFIKRLPAQHPFFLVLTPYSGHSPYTPAAQDIGRCNGIGTFRATSFSEIDRSDQPQYIRQATMPLTEIAKVDTVYRRLCESLYSQDRIIDSIVTALGESNRLDNTYIILTSDHGLQLGEHQLTEQKNVLLEETLHIPFIVRGPNVPMQSIDNTSFIQMADIMPTAVDIGSVSYALPSNGTSVKNQLHGSPVGAKTDVFFEHLDNGSALKYKRGWGIRTAEWFYVRLQWSSALGEQQLYDMVNDPYQMENLAANPAYNSIRQTLLNKVNVYRNQ